MDLINEYMPVLIGAGILLLVLIVLLLVWRTISPRVAGRRGQRLGITEYHELDKTRRLVLIRRDNTEHLIMIGGPQDVVIESGIGVAVRAPDYAAPAPAEPRVVDEPPAAIPLRPAPRPAVFGDRKPPPLRSADAPPRQRDQEP